MGTAGLLIQEHLYARAFGHLLSLCHLRRCRQCAQSGEILTSIGNQTIRRTDDRPWRRRRGWSGAIASVHFAVEDAMRDGESSKLRKV